MKIERQFEVSQPPHVVWDFFQDVEEVAGCMPGAELTGMTEDGGYRGRLSARLGPVKANFDGIARVRTDLGTKTGWIKAEGADREGGSMGQADVEYVIGDNGAGASVDVRADLTLSGRLAQFGRPALVNEISGRLIAEFVDCLEAKLAATTAVEVSAISASEVKGFSLVFGSMWSSLTGAIGRLFGR